MKKLNYILLKIIISSVAGVCTARPLNQGSTVQLRCNFTLAREQFTCTLKPFTRARVELLVASVYYPRATQARLLDDLRELFLTWLRMLTVIDHHSVLRLVLGLVSCSQNLCHRALIH